MAENKTHIKKLDGDIPVVGDVLEMFEGPYGTAIVVKVHAIGNKEGQCALEDIKVDVERVYMCLHLGNPAIGVERLFNINPYNYKFYHSPKGVPQNRSY